MLRPRDMCVTSVLNFVERGTPCELTNTENTILLDNVCNNQLVAIIKYESVRIKIVLLIYRNK